MPGRWPVEIRGTSPAGDLLVLRALRRKDEGEFTGLRRANHGWLSPWEATAPSGDAGPVSYRALLRHYDTEAKGGRMLPFVVTVDGRIVGQMHVFGISYGSLRSCAVGYWVGQTAAGRGIAPAALALAGDYAIRDLGMHRVEVNIRPENTASLAVVRKLGFRDEGVRQRLLHINGAWRDHRSFALTTEDLGGSTLLERLNQRHQQSHRRHTGAGPL